MELAERATAEAIVATLEDSRRPVAERVEAFIAGVAATLVSDDFGRSCGRSHRP